MNTTTFAITNPPTATKVKGNTLTRILKIFYTSFYFRRDKKHNFYDSFYLDSVSTRNVTSHQPSEKTNELTSWRSTKATSKDETQTDNQAIGMF